MLKGAHASNQRRNDRTRQNPHKHLTHHSCAMGEPTGLWVLNRHRSANTGGKANEGSNLSSQFSFDRSCLNRLGFN